MENILSFPDRASRGNVPKTTWRTMRLPPLTEPWHGRGIACAFTRLVIDSHLLDRL